jgi:choline transport protein
MRGRSERVLPSDREFRVPSWLGWVANAMVVIAAVVETVFFEFPASVPISVSSMSEFFPLRIGLLRTSADLTPDYTCVVLAALAVLSCVNWFARGRRSYQGPTLQMQE